MTTLQEQIAETEALLARLKTQEVVENLPLQELATELHTLLCRHNHTDGCAWLYEEDYNTGWESGRTHISYFNRARDLQMLLGPNLTAEDAVAVIQAIRKSR